MSYIHNATLILLLNSHILTDDNRNGSSAYDSSVTNIKFAFFRILTNFSTNHYLVSYITIECYSRRTEKKHSWFSLNLTLGFDAMSVKILCKEVEYTLRLLESMS